MNNIDFWFNSSPYNNILIYNAYYSNGESPPESPNDESTDVVKKVMAEFTDSFIEAETNSIVQSINKTKPEIILIYNIYWPNDKKTDLIKKLQFEHYFYTKKTNDNVLDSGIIILSRMPIVMYSNNAPNNDLVTQEVQNRAAKSFIFSIDQYKIKIDVAADKYKDGYNFHIKFTPTTKKIIHTSKKIMRKIILLKTNTMI